MALSLPEVELVDETLAAKLAGERPLSGVLLHPVAVLDWNHSSCFGLKDWQQSKGHLQYVFLNPFVDIELKVALQYKNLLL